ncbi:hypothetical protein CB0940_06066 [Cercospora beticola]|uniref:Apple domain-containing protein n=1 Tax=Cercospora beticola TaxID=122368 RepID=A0A2G5I0G6_CERBT|nr:hypothetical protein CB0940_06066 [Cercospora beticola]PIA98289.1 hypothetical protein CB0940_06066 [Cercospora beticola]WPA98680.1 hypothetical protein RHO25_003293 [Cercospora beticola]CAK1359946.1 unnamed protein product [Cercospora beticola]
MLHFVLAALLSGAQAQSLVPAYGISADASNSCLRRSVFVYTSASSTYVVTNLGSTSLAATPSFCSNATTTTSTVYGSVSISTVTLNGSDQTITTALPASTITIIQQPTDSPQLPANQTINFDADSAAYQTSASGPQVSAEVVTAGPLQPYRGDNYLLITFGSTGATAVKRQTSQPQAYNVTQLFSAVAGKTYTLNAYASEAQNGDAAPECFLSICAGSTCSQAFDLTSSYALYSYQWTAPGANANALATFSVQCSGPAYIALDDISVATSSQPAPATQTVTQYVTQTRDAVTETQDGSSLVYETVTAITTARDTVTAYTLSLSVQKASTSTTTEYTTVRETTTLSQPQSVVYETVTATSLALVTETAFSLSIVSLNASTSTTTEVTTVQQTTTLSQAPSIVIETVTATTTAIVTETSLSFPLASTHTTTEIATLQLTATETYPLTLPRETYTPFAETSLLTMTLEPSTVTATRVVTPPAVTETVTSTLPRDTTTLPAVTTTQSAPSLLPTTCPLAGCGRQSTFAGLSGITREQCQASCASTTGCVSFQYGSQRQGVYDCYRFSVPVSQARIPTYPSDSNYAICSQYFWYEADGTCAQPPTSTAVRTTTLPASTITSTTTEYVDHGYESICPTPLVTAIVAPGTTSSYQPLCNRIFYAYIRTTSTSTNLANGATSTYLVGIGTPAVTPATDASACYRQCTPITTAGSTWPCLYANWYTSSYSSSTSTMTASYCSRGYGTLMYTYSFNSEYYNQNNNYWSTSYVAYVPATATARPTPA